MPGSVVDLVVPVGDLEDIQSIDAQGAVSGDWSRMEALAGRYKADGVLVAVERAAAGTSGRELKATWYEGPQGSDVKIADGTQGDTSHAGDLTTLLSDLQAGGTTGAATSGTAAGAASGTDTFSMDTTATTGAVAADGQAGATTPGPDAAQLAADVALVRRSIDAQWSAVSMVPEGPEESLIADVPIQGLKQWLDIRDRLTRPASMVDTQLLVISTGKVRVELHYVGALEQLQAGLKQAGLGLTQQGTDWVILPL